MFYYDLPAKGAGIKYKGCTYTVRHDIAEFMIKNRIPSTRKTVTLADSIWAAVEKYRQEHEILTVTDTISRLIKAGLQVKVAIVGKNAKRDAL